MYLPIETLHPAEVPIPGDVKKIVIANPYWPADMHRTQEMAVVDSIKARMDINQFASNMSVQVIVNELYETDRFQAIVPIKRYVRQFEHIDDYRVQKIFKYYDADMLIVLEHMNIVPNYEFDRVPIYDPNCKRDRGPIPHYNINNHPCPIIGYRNNRTQTGLHINYVFKLYFKNPKHKPFDISYTTSYKYRRQTRPPRPTPMPYSYLRANHAMTVAAVQKAGFAFKKLISPYWVPEERMVYSGGGEALFNSVEWMMSGHYNKAIEILKTIENSYDRELAYRAKINLSFCYEAKDILWKAKKYAREAYDINPTEEARMLYNHLYERTLMERELRKQLE